jgi:hypothetical protein
MLPAFDAAAPGAGGPIKFAQLRSQGITGNTSNVTGGGGSLVDTTAGAQAATGFSFHSAPLAADEAEEMCKLEGGHLAYFLSEPEQDNIEKWLVDMVGAWARSPAPGEPQPCAALRHASWHVVAESCSLCGVLAGRPSARRATCCRTSLARTGLG